METAAHCYFTLGFSKYASFRTNFRFPCSFETSGFYFFFKTMHNLSERFARILIPEKTEQTEQQFFFDGQTTAWSLLNYKDGLKLLAD